MIVFLIFNINNLCLLYNVIDLHQYLKTEMKNSNQCDQSQLDFQVMLLKTKQTLRLSLLELETKHKRLNDKQKSQGNHENEEKIEDLEQQCKKYSAQIIILNTKIHDLEKNASEILSKWELQWEFFIAIAQAIYDILNTCKVDKIKMIKIEKESNIKDYEDWIVKSLKLIKMEIINAKKDIFEQKQVHEQKLNSKMWNKNNEEQQIEKYRNDIQKLKQQLSILQVDRNRFIQQEKRAEELLDKIEIRTKNREQLVFMLKGMIKKQKQILKIEAADLQQHIRDGKSRQVEKKKSAHHLLDFLS